ncbi:hypothetical protein L202_02533 [Cryptococcus amylolentus CBS 6039]|uniref:Uncharacterized protein n=2 Tax=Cryptococcus amylolentus TaxID=104669 RepID=A0A1E3I167_9TREE|nr:hypothetical protein L202_02533 [Cryptococcus amylolentus CBS 6039]ODN82248.1 hypothetical protein L202_02533 [Cryptococcus amylolentus CBS 6039]ODO09672.1 hypothetical protein I350_01886 [Cryptococcus amylolentus CBS 6273]
MLGEKVERIVVVVDDLKDPALPFEGENTVKDIRDRVAPLALKRGMSILVVNLPVSPENFEMAGSRDRHVKGDVGDAMVEEESEKGEIKFETMEGWLKTGQWVGVFSQQEVKVLDYYSKPSFHQ